MAVLEEGQPVQRGRALTLLATSAAFRAAVTRELQDAARAFKAVKSAPGWGAGPVRPGPRAQLLGKRGHAGRVQCCRLGADRQALTV